MAEKKKTTATKPKNVGKAPTLSERITDYSTNSLGKGTWLPKRTPKKK